MSSIGPPVTGIYVFALGRITANRRNYAIVPEQSQELTWNCILRDSAL
jgi:hypothetical protein